MDAVAGLLRTDVAGQCDLGEHRGSIVAAAGVYSDQAGERGTELDPSGGEPLAHLVSGNPGGVCRQKFGDVVARRTSVVVDRGQRRHHLSDSLAVLLGLHCELRHGGAPDRCDGRDVGVLIE